MTHASEYLKEKRLVDPQLATRHRRKQREYDKRYHERKKQRAQLNQPSQSLQGPSQPISVLPVPSAFPEQDRDRRHRRAIAQPTDRELAQWARRNWEHPLGQQQPTNTQLAQQARSRSRKRSNRSPTIASSTPRYIFTLSEKPFWSSIVRSFHSTISIHMKG